MIDSESEHSPIDNYPWYRIVGDGSLEQGDLLMQFPTVSVTSSYDQLGGEDVDFEISYFDVIVLTQSCDLSAGKIENVILCPFFHKDKLVDKFKDLGKSDGEKAVQRGKWESLYLLPPCEVGTVKMSPRVVNFRQVLTVPFHIVATHSQRQQIRPRLCPPYREHLAQAFARFVMRIGFPIDFRL